ncbi:MAG: MbeD/MobD family mobilization/exclusion protein [Candidatus Thorarchaeota archaeon]|jgi:small GTP-binding protein
MSGHPGWQFKICLIGDGYVGKTSIRRKYLGTGFRANYIPTLGVDFANKSVELDGTPTTLIIWDIAGQPAFQSLRKRYYDGASGIILTYSVVDRESFDNASKWLVEAHGFMGEIPPLIIVANKVDLRSSHPLEESVTPDEGEAFAKRIGERLNTQAIFIETSAVTGENIDDAFATLTRMMIEEAKPQYIAPVQSAPSQTGESVSDSSADESEDEVSTTESSPEQLFAKVSSTTTEPTSDSVPSETGSTAESADRQVDPITSLPADSQFLHEDDIGRDMTRLVDLRSRLKSTEDELARTISDLETSLLNLKNIVHVKRIMYEHLLQQLRQTRQEWADAYDEFQKIDETKKDELAKRSREIEGLRREIEGVGRSIRKRVSELELKKMTSDS